MISNPSILVPKNLFITNRKYNIFYIRLTVNIVIAYMMLFNPESLLYQNLAYLFVAIFLLSNYILFQFPEKYFYKKELLYILCTLDTIIIAVGIYLTGYSDTYFFIIYFLIIGLAAMSMDLKYLIANTFMFIFVYGWILYMNSQLAGKFITANLLRLSFILTVALLFGYIIQCVVRDINRYVQIGNYALNDALNGIALTDLSGKIFYANPSFVEMRNHNDSSDILGKNIHDYIHKQREVSTLSKAFLSRNNWRGEIQFRKKKEGLLELKVAASLINDELGNALCYMISFEDITPRKNAELKLKKINMNLERLVRERTKELEIQSLTDNLTGLYNRSFFEAEMGRLSGDRYYPMSIIICDIDGLKLINDTCGHNQGDKLLKDAADVLKRCFRASDIIARIGGDEFAVLLPQQSQEIVKMSCNRIRQKVEDYNQQHSEFALSISIGYAVKNNPPVDMNELFKRADNAMYREKLQQSYSSRSAIVQALIKTMEARDHITEGHANRLQENAQKLGLHLGLSEERLHDLQLLARFHDLGKVGVPDSILYKPCALTEEEFEEMKRHCEVGHRIALSTSDLAPIADYILKHHEWWNGKGYPLGVQGKEIPLECRILAIVDAFDAMTNHRPYREAMSFQEAVQELRRCAGSQFDPELVEIFIQIVNP